MCAVSVDAAGVCAVMGWVSAVVVCDAGSCVVTVVSVLVRARFVVQAVVVVAVVVVAVARARASVVVVVDWACVVWKIFA